MSDGPLVELRGVHAGYDGIDVLHGVDLVVGAGEVVAIGAAGAIAPLVVRRLRNRRAADVVG